MDAPITMSAAPGARLISYRAALTLFLAYGGIGLLQWFNDITGQGQAPQAHSLGDSSLAQWLREGTLAVPLVAAAVYLATRRTPNGVSTGSGTTLAVQFAAIVGAGSLLRRLFPDTTQAGGAHDAVLAVSTPQILEDTLITMIVAALFALFAGRLLLVLSTFQPGPLNRLPVPGRRARLALALVVAVAVLPPFLLNSSTPVIAQTSFPDQPIHPKDSLLLVARVLDDGWWGFVAPAYGKLGIRPIIEMTEGETLNITLVNEFYKDVSLHVHGVLYGQDSDGTRHSGSFVKPGDFHVYQWRAVPGTAGYWHYHDHVVGDDEGTVGIENGFYGGLIVRKPGDPRPSKTFMLVFHNLTINGRQYPNTPTPSAREGDMVEFLVVSYMDTMHTFHLHGHRWLTPTRPGNPPASQGTNTVNGREDNHVMAPGDSFGFITIAGEGVGPGMWMYHCHVQSHSGLMLGFFQVLPRAQGSGLTSGN
jgi:hypothetical protein